MSPSESSDIPQVPAAEATPLKSGNPTEEKDLVHPPKLMALVLSWVLGGILLLGLWIFDHYRLYGDLPVRFGLVRLCILPTIMVMVGCGLFLRLPLLRDFLLVAGLLGLFFSLTILAAKFLRWLVTGAIDQELAPFDYHIYLRSFAIALACALHVWCLVDDDVNYSYERRLG